MKRVHREIVALVVGLTGIGLAAVGFNAVLEIGTCSSGGPYVSARPCPDNASSVFWTTFGGALLWAVGMLVSTRIFVPGAGLILWVVGFAGGGAATLVKVRSDSTIGGDARLGGTIMAVTFLLNGLVVAAIGIFQLVRRRTHGQGQRHRDRRAGAAATRRGRSPFYDLENLRSTGALTREEFTLLRADLENAGPGEEGLDRIERIRRIAQRRDSGALSTGEFERQKRSILR
ncbi:hypothetical protein GCM10009557_32420 [Virgisporangium ochraceum]|uniref:SHOCT domain-containing protein n=1 Tax=Virgisporangium ochraceum TaxID=65505 RepID=A0A8J4EDI9_9ACTN|nr:SHOCT domain-containing protein [Virgisporangium ochraceum]GIJ70749.1 hypothetical protein Voc01_056660 [Virgisporangium ochraceum]